MYTTASRQATTYEARVNYILKNKIIRPGENFNLIQLSRDYTFYVPAGDEYRFFFRKAGTAPKPIIEYANAETLLILSELPQYDIKKLDSWEINQFGREYLTKPSIYKYNDLIIYKLQKKK